MVPFNQTESRYTQNCLVIKQQRENVIRIGYKYTAVHKLGVLKHFAPGVGVLAHFRLINSDKKNRQNL